MRILYEKNFFLITIYDNEENRKFFFVKHFVQYLNINGYSIILNKEHENIIPNIISTATAIPVPPIIAA